LAFAINHGYYNPNLNLAQAFAGKRLYYEDYSPSEKEGNMATRQFGLVTADGQFNWREQDAALIDGTKMTFSPVFPPGQWAVFEWADVMADVAFNQGKYFERPSADESPLYKLVSAKEVELMALPGGVGIVGSKAFELELTAESGGAYSRKVSMKVQFAKGQLLKIDTHNHFDETGEWKEAGWEKYSAVGVDPATL
jgi:hypothetical protein